jgi:hypothetical protein
MQNYILPQHNPKEVEKKCTKHGVVYECGAGKIGYCLRCRLEKTDELEKKGFLRADINRVSQQDI